MIDLVRLLLNHKFYEENKYKLLKEMMPSSLYDLYDLIIASHDKYQRDLSIDELKALYKVTYPVTTEAKKDLVFQVLDKLPEVGEDAAKEVLEKAWIIELGRQITEAGTEIVQGQTTSFEKARTIITKINEGELSSRDELQAVSSELEDVLDALNITTKWNFNLGQLKTIAKGIGPGTFSIIFARVEAGKCLGKDTPILMFDGTIKKAQDIIIGDKLMGPDNNCRNVLSTIKGNEQLFKIKYNFGEEYIVNKSHILSLKRSGTERIHKTGDICNVSVEEYLKWPQGRKDRYKGWKCSSLEFPNNFTHPLISSYFLGLWLGDGSSSCSSITNTDKEIVKYIFEIAKENKWNIRIEKNITYNLSGISTKWCPQKALRDLGVLNNKHIPKSYLLNTSENRYLLLAGLIDSDGYKSKNSYEIVQKSERLAKDIVFLARSLGHHCTIKVCFKSATNGRLGNIGKYYRISIYDNLYKIPVKLERKKIYVTNVKPKRLGLHFGFTIEPITDTTEYFGFTIDKDKLFVLGDFTVTHNTALWISLCAAPKGFADQGALVHCYCNEESAQRTQGRAIMSYTGMPLLELLNNKEEAREIYSRIKDKIKFFECKGMEIGQIHNHIDRHHPDIVVIDQLDKLSIKGVFQRRDEMLGNLYSTSREIGARCGSAVIAISQANADGEGKHYLSSANLADSRTSKAAEGDLVLGVGKGQAHDEYQRTINVIKNKITGNHTDIVCYIKPEVSRFID